MTLKVLFSICLLCLHKKTVSKPNFYNFRPETLPQCPEAFTNAGNFCYKLSEKAPFRPKCPFENVLPFDSYKDVISKENGPVWLPVQKIMSKGFEVLQWIEPSSRYKIIFDDFFVSDSTNKGRNCLLYYNSSYVVAVSCQEEHSSVCAYKKLDQLKNPLCGAENICHQSGLSAKSKCICLKTSNATVHSKAEFLEPYQNNVYGLLTNETCIIGLEKAPNATFVWTTSKKTLDYSFFSSEVDFDDSHNYIASTPNGWLLINQPVSCYLIEKEAIRVSPRLSLSLSDDGNLVISVFNPIGLKVFDSGSVVYCFTDADLILLYRYPSLTLIKSTDSYIAYQFEPFKKDPGHYWCESFRYVDMKVIISNVIFLDSDGTWEKKFVTFNHFFGPNITTFLNNVLNNSNLYQILKISDVDEKKNKVGVDVQVIIAPRKAEESFTLFLGCNTLNENGLSWPRTDLGETAFSVEYCFKSNGSRLERLCTYYEYDYTWAPITENCTIQSESLISPNLTSLDKIDDDDEAITSLLAISQIYTSFNSLDVYISASVFHHLICAQGSVCDKLPDIVDNILNIKENILSEAQLKMCATTAWLDNLHHMNVNWTVRNFAFLFGYEVQIRGIIKTNFSGSIELSSIASEDTLYDIVTKENFESALWLNIGPGVIEGIAKYYIFYKKGFFPDAFTTLPTGCSIDVFGFYLYFTGEPSQTKYVVHKYDSTTFAMNVSCLYWDAEECATSSWKKGGEFQIYKSTFICKFWQNDYFTLALTSPVEVTEILEDILSSGANSSELLSRLYQVSSRYDEFVPLDVFLVSEILKKVDKSTDNDLELLNKLIHFLQKIKKEVLLESQMEFNATDKILYYTDFIIKNQESFSDLQFITANFIVLILHLNSSDFNGFVLKQNGSIDFLSSITNTTELLQFENVDSALILSPELKSQMDPDAKIIVNVFFEDVFFNEKEQHVKHQNVTKIYDIILPEDLTYSGPVTIVYNTSNYERVCSFWSYNVPEKVTGFWQNDSIGKDLYSLTQCDFWHTTHFAFLILDQDKYSEEDMVLDLITNITLVLSLFGFLWIILTAVLFKSWRSKTGNKILLNFVFSGILEIVVFYVSSGITKGSRIVCISTGILLHYSVVAQFCWMLTTAVLQFRRFVLVFHNYPQNILLKTCLFAWGFPLVPVICVLVVDVNSYVSSTVGLCYPSGFGLYIGVWLPLAVIIVLNLLMFAYIIRTVLMKRTECFGGDDTIYQWRLIIFFFFIMGLTWVFGFLAEIDNSIVLVYLFCILASLQGFVMFLFFIMLNEKVRDLYMHKEYTL